jgi:alpha-1,2-mannosyltransferase
VIGVLATSRRAPLRRVAIVACLVSLLVWAVVMTVFMLHTPAGDFAVYRNLAPAAFDDRGLHDVRLGPLAFTYPAFAAVPLSLLQQVGFGTGLFLMTLASIAALTRTAIVLARAVFRERVSALPISPMMLVLVFLAVAVWFAPVTKTLLNGQLNLILLWLVVEDLLGAVPPKYRGLLTGLATGIKLTPALFIVAMLVTGRRAWAVRASAAFAVTVAIGFVVEPAGSLEYWRKLGGSDGFGSPEGYSNQSIMYALVRIADQSDYHLFLPVGIALALLALVIVRRLHDRGHELASWGVTAIAMLAVTPVSWTHHWVWLLLPLAALVATMPTGEGGHALLVSTVVVLWSGIVQLAPHLQPHGIGRAFGLEIIGNAYLLMGLALLIWFGRLAWSESGGRAHGGDRAVDLEDARTLSVPTPTVRSWRPGAS